MGYGADLAQGLNRLEPTKASKKTWAEQQLVEVMADFKLSRDEALELAKIHAPTIYRWVQSG